MPLDPQTKTVNDALAREIAKDLLRKIDELKATHGGSPREMLAALILVICGFAAMHRERAEAPLSMAGWLATQIANGFLAAHAHMTKRVAETSPAG